MQGGIRSGLNTIHCDNKSCTKLEQVQSVRANIRYATYWCILCRIAIVSPVEADMTVSITGIGLFANLGTDGRNRRAGVPVRRPPFILSMLR